MKTINRKIPGILPPPPKTELDGKITDLSSKPLQELVELRDRQEKLLKNKPFISKLADKGQKIQLFYDKIQAELSSKRNEEEETLRMLHNLKLTEIDKETIKNVEWGLKPEEYLDSDDDSDPEGILQILSKSRTKEKIVKIQSPEKPLITPEDLENISETGHIKYIVENTENKANINKNKTKESFKPYKSTITDVHDSSKEVLRKKHKHWENTSATPPPMLHAPAKLLTIEESLALQKEHNIHMKEVEAQHAAEKLAATRGIKLADISMAGASFVGYREIDSDHSNSDPEGSDKEVYDEEPDRGGGVVFTVMK